MANWSNTTIQLNGSEKNIGLAYQELMSLVSDGFLNPENTKLFKSKDMGYSIMQDIDINITKNSIEITGLGRWSSPYNYIVDLVQEFNLSGSYIDMEESMDFTHTMLFNNGHMIDEQNDAYFSDLSIKHLGIDNFLFDLSWIAEEENWEEEYSNHIKLFNKYGITIEQLHEEWD
jgi:hypothetical protein